MSTLFATHALVPHRGNRAGDIGVSVAVAAMDDGRWRLDWRIAGNDVVYPHPARPERLDGLWQTTCVEVFAMRADGTYLEWNFAPSGAWAAYEFSDYRARISPPPMVEPPVIAWDDGKGSGRVAVDVQAAAGRGPLRVGLSAVVERGSGDRDYFALAHPQGRPDFHAPDCFALHHSPPKRA